MSRKLCPPESIYSREDGTCNGGNRRCFLKLNAAASERPARKRKIIGIGPECQAARIMEFDHRAQVTNVTS